MIDLELTPKIKAWLDADPASRSFAEGADLLLRVSKNRILYANITRNPKAKASTLEYHLRKIYLKRIQDTTHEQVRSMMKQVDAIDRARGLSRQPSANRSELQRGRRADHDLLPPEIRQLYVDNADIMRRMRDLHTHLRLISPDNSSCPDSDRYPFAKELLALDRRYRDNWNTYDHYIRGTAAADVVKAVDPRSAQANARKLCNLLLGKFAKAPDDALAARIRAAYAAVDAPSEALTAKMKEAGLL